MFIIGSLETPYVINGDGSHTFDIAKTANAADLEVEFRFIKRKVEPLDAKLGSGISRAEADDRALYRAYMRAIKAELNRIADNANDNEDITLDEPAPAAAPTVIEVAPAPVIEPELVRPASIVESDAGDRFVVATADVDQRAQALGAEQVELIAASMRGVVIDAPSTVVDTAPAPEAAIFASVGSTLRDGRSLVLDRGARVTFDEVGLALKGIAEGRADRPDTRVLYHRDKLAGIDGVQRVQPGRLSDDANRAALAWQRENSNALLAALCGPGELDRDQALDAIDNSRPLAGLFGPPVAVGMGIHEFFRGMGLADMYAYFAANPTAHPGIGLWTTGDQAAVDPTDPNTWKQCLTLPPCPTTFSVTAYWLYRCLKLNIEDQMSRPQYIANVQTMMEVLLARLGEQVMLQSIDAWSYKIACGNTYGYGAVDQLFYSLEVLFAWVNSNYRTRYEGYTLVIPEVLLNACRIDAFRAASYSNAADPGQVLDQLRSILSEVGVNLLVTPDWGPEGNLMAPLPAQPYPGATNNSINLPQLPTTYVARLVPPSDFVWGSVGVEDYGVDTSPELKRQNMVQFFAETAEIFYKKGHRPSFTLTMTGIAPTGARPDRVAPTLITAMPGAPLGTVAANNSVAALPGGSLAHKVPSTWPNGQITNNA